MFQKQPAMRRVLYSLAPIFLFSLWLYGPRVLLLLGLSLVLGIGTEYLMERRQGKKVSEAVLVSCSLYALSLPPLVPAWIAGLGIVFGVFMAKEVYGGFGRNLFNPAIAGRLFVYISFATAMQAGFVQPGNFGLGVDAVGSATPLALLAKGEDLSLLPLLLGLRSGSIGEGAAILIVAAGMYLVATKTASWRLILSTLASGGILALILILAGVSRALPLESLLAGSFLFVAVFMVTDPVSAPKKPLAQWCYGGIVGACIVLIRTFSLFPEGTSFAVLLGNVSASLLDDFASSLKVRWTQRKAGS